jgi:drug/metabolite transporter (DMT)-like permease
MTQTARGHLAMLVFSVLVAGSFSLGSLTANLLSPSAFTTARFLVAAVVIGGIAVAGGHIRRPAFVAPWRYVVLGSIFASYFVLMFEGLKTAPPVSTAAVFTLTPVLTAGFGWLLLRQITTRRMAFALGIGAAGALWVIFRADWQAALRFNVGRGESIYFAGCIAHAVYIPLVRMLNRGEGPLVFTFGTLLAGFVTLSVWSWPDVRATNWAHLPAIAWITLGYTAIFASAATFFLTQYAALRLPAAKVMAYTYLTPSWVIAWEIALGHGAPRLLAIVGVAMTVLAVFMLLKDETLPS